jgi:hypothetical protein
MSMMMELTPDDVHDLLTKGGIDPFPETDEHGGDAQGDGKDRCRVLHGLAKTVEKNSIDIATSNL